MMPAFIKSARTIAIVLLVITACTRPKLANYTDIVAPNAPVADSIDAVVIFVGDAGEELTGQSPLLTRMKQDIEVWSEKLRRDSAVTVLFLGDNVYPKGIRDRGTPEFPQDSAILWSQIDLLDGPKARARGTIGFFVPGNHDWGNMAGEAGLARLKNMEEQIQIARNKKGIPVQMAPAAGLAGPAVRDIRENMRLMMIDTHLYLQERSRVARAEFIAGLERAMREAGDRHVLIAAHHPFTTAGPHGDVIAPLTRAFGLVFLLEKSGTLVQDLNSPIYKDLLRQLKQVFTTVRPPLAFIGGHDHSLQVHAARSASDPKYSFVSGGGSKSNPLVGADSMRYGTSRPGYMSLYFYKSGAVDLFVIAGRSTEASAECPPPEKDVACPTRDAISFGIVYSERIAFFQPPPSDSLSRAAAAPGRPVRGRRE